MPRYSSRAGFISLQEEDILTAIENIEERDGKLDFDYQLLRGGAESTKKRNASEALKRLRNSPRNIWSEIVNLSPKDQKIALYYLVLKSHAFFFDFHMEVILQKWQVMDKAFSKDDVLTFIEKKVDEHPELENWSEESKRRSSRTIKLMLEQIDMLDENQNLRPVQGSISLWELFIKEGETWFLEAMLLNKQERDELINSAAV